MWRLDSMQPPRVVVHPDALRVFHEHRQIGALPERGGLLLGEIHENGTVLFVSCASVPGAEDRSSRFSWNRDQDRANRIIREKWEQSNGLINYLGEWHTHPQDDPRASCVDMATMFRLVRRKTLVTQGLLMVIVGRESVLTQYWTRRGYCHLELSEEECQ